VTRQVVWKISGSCQEGDTIVACGQGCFKCSEIKGTELPPAPNLIKGQRAVLVHTEDGMMWRIRDTKKDAIQASGLFSLVTLFILSYWIKRQVRREVEKLKEE